MFRGPNLLRCDEDRSRLAIGWEHVSDEWLSIQWPFSALFVLKWLFSLRTGQENKVTTKLSSIKFCLNNEKSNRVMFFKFIIGNPTCVKIEDFDAITMVTNCHKISIECKTQSCRLRGGRLGFLQRRLLFTLPNEIIFQCWSKGGTKGGEWTR